MTPPYTLRIHPRARRVRLRVDSRGLTLVAPPGFDPARAEGILAAHGPWIAQALARHAPAKPAPPPEHLELRAVGRRLRLDMAAREAGGVTVIPNGPDRLLLRGAVADPQALRDGLLAWLRGAARDALTPWLRRISGETGLPCAAVTIRAPRSRWGSCSRCGRISLSARLLFLPPELVRSVLIHELCHTRHMDHSARFWALVEIHDPDWKEHRAAIRQAGRFIPDLLA